MYVVDHLDDNVGQLLEAYIQNKTTPSSFGNILEKVRESGFGSALKFILGFDITKEQLCTICPIGFNFVALERRQGMTNIQLTGEIAYFCSTLGIETEEVCLGLIEPVVVCCTVSLKILLYIENIITKINQYNVHIVIKRS